MGGAARRGGEPAGHGGGRPVGSSRLPPRRIQRRLLAVPSAGCVDAGPGQPRVRPRPVRFRARRRPRLGPVPRVSRVAGVQDGAVVLRRLPPGRAPRRAGHGLRALPRHAELRRPGGAEAPARGDALPAHRRARFRRLRVLPRGRRSGATRLREHADGVLRLPRRGVPHHDRSGPRDRRVPARVRAVPRADAVERDALRSRAHRVSAGRGAPGSHLPRMPPGRVPGRAIGVRSVPPDRIPGHGEAAARGQPHPCRL